MKNHKKTIVTLLTAAVLLIAAFMTGCTTQTQVSNKDAALGTNFSDEEFAKLSALQFDGYEEMTVSEFQNKVWELTDTNEYHSLLERFSLDATLYEQKGSNALASFLFYTLEPLTAEKWQTREFRGGTTTDYPGAVDNASLEFVYSLTVQNADTLTVGEYNVSPVLTLPILDEIDAGVTVGTAGSSLLAVQAAVKLLDWGMNTGLGADEISDAASTWLAAKNNDLADCLKKLELVDNAYQKLLTDEARELLDSAGCEKVEIIWGSAPVEPIEAIMQAAGLRK